MGLSRALPMPLASALVATLAFAANAGLAVRLTSPQYRNSFYPGQRSACVAGVVRTGDGSAATVTIEGAGLARRLVTVADGATFSLDTAGFEIGEALLTATGGGETKTVRIRRLADTGRMMSWVENGNLVTNGVPFIRRSIYAEYYMTGECHRQRYDAERDSFRLTEFPAVSIEMSRIVKGRNLETEEGTGDGMPSAVLFEAIDRLIEANRDRDFGCYYICDEPECRKISPVYLRQVYDHVAERDPYHVIAMATRGGERYIDCADLLETHPYLNPGWRTDGSRTYGVHPNRVGDFVDDFHAEAHPDKCIGFLPTCFAYRNQSAQNDYPTFDEYELHVWAAALRGAKTLWPYAGHDMGDRPSLHEGARYMFESFEALEDFLLFGRRSTFVKDAAIEGAVWELDGRRLVVVCNFTDAATNAVFGADCDGTYREFRGLRTFTVAGGVSDRPVEIGPMRTLVAVAGARPVRERLLRSRAQVAEAVARGEAERTGRDNQLQDRDREVLITSNLSNLDSYAYKLIDGVRDVLAGYSRYQTNAFVELAASGAPFRFDRVRLFGMGLDTAAVSVRRADEWTSLPPVSTETVTNAAGMWMHEISFSETNETCRLRIELPGRARCANSRELYEVELPRLAGAAEASEGRGEALPDEGVTVRFDGQTARRTPQQSCDGWHVDADKFGDVRIDGNADGSFTYAVTDGRIGRYMKMSPETDWIVADFASFDALPVRGYRYWTLCFADKSIGLLGSTVTHPEAGIYAFPLPKIEKPGMRYLAFYNQRLAITLNHVSLMRKPASRVELTLADGAASVCPGTRVRVEAHFAHPAQDVQAEWLVARSTGDLKPYRVNGTSGIDLRPVDAEGRVWSASIDVRSLAENAPVRTVYVRATLLGVRNARPVHSNFLVPFSTEPKASRSTGETR